MPKLLRTPMEEYKGHHIGCAPGTHAAVCKLVSKHVPIRGAVVDIGAHSGALLLRLRDLGFEDLTGTDLDTTRFDVPNADFFQLELNDNFAERFEKRFNLITSTEVIEHLDSPRAFLNNAWEMLDDNGFLALSFPNVAFWEGRIKFLWKGELWGFGASNYLHQRHISPMTREQSELTLRELGFNIVEITTAGSFATPLKRVITAPLWAPIRILGGASALGESMVILAQKTKRATEREIPTHYQKRWKGIPDNIGLGA